MPTQKRVTGEELCSGEAAPLDRHRIYPSARSSSAAAAAVHSAPSTNTAFVRDLDPAVTEAADLGRPSAFARNAASAAFAAPSRGAAARSTSISSARTVRTRVSRAFGFTRQRTSTPAPPLFLSTQRDTAARSLPADAILAMEILGVARRGARRGAASIARCCAATGLTAPHLDRGRVLWPLPVQYGTNFLDLPGGAVDAGAAGAGGGIGYAPTSGAILPEQV